MPDVSGSISLTLYHKNTTNVFLLSVFFFLTASALRQWAFLLAQTVKSLPAVLGDLGSIPGLGRSPGEGNGNLCQYSYLGNPMDGGTQQATFHGVAKSQTWLSGFTFSFKATGQLQHEGWPWCVPSCPRYSMYKNIYVFWWIRTHAFLWLMWSLWKRMKWRATEYNNAKIPSVQTGATSPSQDGHVHTAVFNMDNQRGPVE